MRLRTWVALVCLPFLGSAGCGQSSPAAPGTTVTQTDDAGAGPGGITLKAPAPELLSPANGAMISSTSTVAFVVGRVQGLNATFPITFEFDIARQGGTQLDNTRLTQGLSGNTTYTMTRQLDVNTVYTWRVRATYQGAFGPWSPTFTFRTPDIPAGHVLPGEIVDPLLDGRTVGTIVGGVNIIPGVGAQILNQSSLIRYTLTTPLEAGEMSMMVTNFDVTSPGDKSKVFSMQQGDSDITDNAYRFTAEMRGSAYAEPGTVAFRIIYGDGEARDGERQVLSFSRTRWYYWRFSWRTGSATLQVRADGPTGPVLYEQNVASGASPYRPVPHRVYIGAPIGRAGPIDASLGGMIVKDFRISALPRPMVSSQER